MKEIHHMGEVSSLYLKLLIPHEVEGFFDLGNCAGAFPAEVCGCPPVQIICAFLFRAKEKKKTEK